MRKTTRKIASLVLAGALIVTAVPVSSDAAAAVKLNTKSVSLKVKGTKTLKVSKASKKVKSITKKVFTSDKKSVATVGKTSGKITAKKAGNATITCNVTYKIKSGKKVKTKKATLTCSVKVTKTTTPATQAPATQAPTSQAPASQAPASETPASGTPASQTPASGAPVTQTPASQAPATGTPDANASASPAASASASPAASASASPAASASAAPSILPATAAPAKATATPTPSVEKGDYTGTQFELDKAENVSNDGISATSIKFEKLFLKDGSNVTETVDIRISKVDGTSKTVDDGDLYKWNNAGVNGSFTFTGLESGKSYTFAARVGESESHKADSRESELVLTTKGAESDPSYAAFVALKEKLQDAKAESTVSMSENVTVPEGYELTIPKDVTLDIRGYDLINNGTVTVNGEVDTAKSPDGTGIWNIEANGTFVATAKEANTLTDGTMNFKSGAKGYLYNGGAENNKAFYIGGNGDTTAFYQVTEGIVTLKPIDEEGKTANMIIGDGTTATEVTLAIGNEIQRGQILEISANAKFTVNEGADFTIKGKVVNNGTIMISGNMIVESTGRVNNTGKIEGMDKIKATTAGSFETPVIYNAYAATDADSAKSGLVNFGYGENIGQTIASIMGTAIDKTRIVGMAGLDVNKYYYLVVSDGDKAITFGYHPVENGVVGEAENGLKGAYKQAAFWGYHETANGDSGQWVVCNTPVKAKLYVSSSEMTVPPTGWTKDKDDNYTAESIDAAFGTAKLVGTFTTSGYVWEAAAE